MTVLSDVLVRQSTIGFVAEFSVSLPDDLMRALKRAAGGDVSAFAAEAIRKELARRHLGALVQELVDEVGPVDEAEVARISAMLAEVDAVNAAAGKAEGEEL